MMSIKFTAYSASVLFSDQLQEVNYAANCCSSHVKDVQAGWFSMKSTSRMKTFLLAVALLSLLIKALNQYLKINFIRSAEGPHI